MRLLEGKMFKARLEHAMLPAYEIEQNSMRPHTGDGADEEEDGGSGANAESKTDGIKIFLGLDLLKQSALEELFKDHEAGFHLLKDVDAAKEQMAADIRRVTSKSGASGSPVVGNQGGAAMDGEGSDDDNGGGGGGGGAGGGVTPVQPPLKKPRSAITMMASATEQSAMNDNISAKADHIMATSYAESVKKVSPIDMYKDAVKEADNLFECGLLSEDDVKKEKDAAKAHFMAQRGAQRQL